jgi:hypothetical protein
MRGFYNEILNKQILVGVSCIYAVIKITTYEMRT